MNVGRRQLGHQHSHALDEDDALIDGGRLVHHPLVVEKAQGLTEIVVQKLNEKFIILGERIQLDLSASLVGLAHLDGILIEQIVQEGKPLERCLGVHVEAEKELLDGRSIKGLIRKISVKVGA